MSLIKTINFPPLGDDRGSLVALESFKTVPFEIKRVYYIFGTKEGVARGFHAHKTLHIIYTTQCEVMDGARILSMVVEFDKVERYILVAALGLNSFNVFDTGSSSGLRHQLW